MKECEKELQDFKRLKLVEQSVIAGLKEEGFSDKAVKYFRYRKNFLLDDDPLKENADSVGGFTGTCGDHVDIYLKIDEGVIQDAKYQTDGCPGAVTSASAVTELAKNKTLGEARRVTVKDVVDHLKEGPKGLPKHMYDCCRIAVGSLREAINQYKRQGRV